MTIAEKNLHRALCYGQDTADIENFEWREGYLGWIERMGYCVVSDEAEERDRYNYYIGCKKPNSSADWGLPFPQAKFYIPDSMRHTITKSHILSPPLK